MSALMPGATIGVLGGGQLGRMMAVTARQMGYRIVVLDPSARCPTAQVSDGVVVGALDDTEAAMLLARQVDVITLDTEHVPADLLAELERVVPVRPGAAVLRTIQDRLVQKQFLDRIGMPQAKWAEVGLASERAQAVAERASASERAQAVAERASASERAQADDHLDAALARVGRPAIVKVRRAGYDGKGQYRIDESTDPQSVVAKLRGEPAVVEEVVRFVREISVVLARDVRGAHRIYPIAENVHQRHILHTTRAPAPMSDAQRKAAEDIAVHVADSLGHVGVMAVEMFELANQRLLVNEIAPRTHNSGHYTYGACATSQFEQHVRAICGLPLGDPRALTGAVMVNLIGDLWSAGPPPWEHVLALPQARLHLYGKDLAAPGRKMGHVVLLDDDTDRALASANALIDALTARP